MHTIDVAESADDALIGSVERLLPVMQADSLHVVSEGQWLCELQKNTQFFPSLSSQFSVSLFSKNSIGNGKIV